MMGMAAINIEKLSKRYRPGLPLALSALTGDLPMGKISGIVGPDGAGKTTLMRLVAGLLKPDEGSCHVMGKNSLSEAQAIQQFLGYMPQKFGLYEELTVEQNLSLYGDLQGVDNKKAVFTPLLAFAGLEHFQKRLARQLSGGMKQKLGLICCLIREPKVLLLDEPSTGVDPRSQRELWTMIQHLKEKGVTVLWSTSYLEEADQCDTLFLLDRGKLLYSGPPADLTKRVKGRSFHVSGLGGEKRNVLEKLTRNPAVFDTTIQGKALRIVLKEGVQADNLRDFGLDREGDLQPTPPRFEDAFIDLLGGLPQRPALEHHVDDGGMALSENPVNALDLTKKFGSFTAVDHLTFHLNRGEIFGLLGPNGAGKSTTFKMLCGLLKATSGTSSVGGYSMQEAPTRARKLIGYMAQRFSLYDNLTLIQNMRFFGGVYGVDNLSHRIEEMLEVFDMKRFVDVFPKNLSLGYKQRLALACALIHSPPLLFLDEPTSGVDPLTRREFWHQINHLTQCGTTVLVSTHLMDEAEFCDRIGFIYEGKLKVVDTPDGLKDRVKSPAHPNPTLSDAFLYLCSNPTGG